jgi:hypothetical protein
VAVDDNSTRSKQSIVTGCPSRLRTLLFARRDSKFLIANLELEIRATTRKQTTELKSNRKYFAIFHPASRSAARFSLATRHPSLVTALLIETKSGFSKSFQQARHYRLRPDIKKYSL